MRGSCIVWGAFLAGFAATCLACAARTPPAADPTSVEASSEVASSQDGAATEGKSSGQTLDVGMEFEDKGDAETRRTSHEAPPTATWKPVEKEKTTESRKPAVTAAR